MRRSILQSKFMEAGISGAPVVDLEHSRSINTVTRNNNIFNEIHLYCSHLFHVLEQAQQHTFSASTEGLFLFVPFFRASS